MKADATINPITDDRVSTVVDSHTGKKSDDDAIIHRTDDEINQIMHMQPYKPRLNGPIDPDCVQNRATLQLGKKISPISDDGHESKPSLPPLIEVPESVVKDRVRRIVHLDTAASAETARSLVSCLEDNRCEKLIKKNGETILLTIRCVAFLNAPQSNEDHIGDGRLYLTKSASPDETKVKHRLFFYSYADTPNQHYEEETTSKKSRSPPTFFDEDHVILSKLNETITKTVTENIERTVEGAFLSLSLEDLIGAYHTLSDFTEIQRDSIGSVSSQKEVKCGNYSCLRNFLLCNWCMFSWCCKSCTMPCCQIIQILLDWFSNAAIWKWTFTTQEKNDINRLIFSYAYSVEKDPESLQYDPLSERDMVMPFKTTKLIHTKRFHTINLTYLESSDSFAKRRGVVVLAPDEDSALAVDMVCMLTSITDDLRSKEWRGNSKESQFKGRDPLKESSHLRGKEDMGSLTGAVVVIQVKIGWEYKFGVCYFNILLAFICFVACIAALVSGASIYFLLNFLYSMAHMGVRYYDRNKTEYKIIALLKDCLAALFGLIFSIIATVSPSSDTAASSTGVALATHYSVHYISCVTIC
eukprot:gene28801-37807_t